MKTRKNGSWAKMSTMPRKFISTKRRGRRPQTTLFNFSVDSANRHYRYENGLLTSYDGDTLVMVIGNWTDNKTLPEGTYLIYFFINFITIF